MSAALTLVHIRSRSVAIFAAMTTAVELEPIDFIGPLIAEPERQADVSDTGEPALAMMQKRNPADQGGARVVAKAGDFAASSVHESASHRERDDNYCRVHARLGDGWRVIECADCWQWILQRRTRAASPDGARWEAVAYHLGRDALLRSVRAFCAAPDPAALATLAALPPHHPGMATLEAMPRFHRPRRGGGGA